VEWGIQQFQKVSTAISILASSKRRCQGRHETVTVTEEFIKSSKVSHVYCSTIYNSQVMETAKMPHHLRMDQENVVSIHNGILCSHEDERNVIIRW
jgi:hypothetical protein